MPLSKRLLLLFFFFCWTKKAMITAQNLVPNPSFEAYSTFPLTWKATKVKFDEGMLDWSSPNEGSPDLLVRKNNTIDIKPIRPHLDSRPYIPRTGSAMIGLKLFGCATNVHCKEYVQVALTDSLIVGREYELSFWVSPVFNSLRIDKVGAAFSDTLLQDKKTREIPYLKPVLENKGLIDKLPNQWHQVSGKFIASQASKYLIIGNFRSDASTKVVKKSKNNLDYAFYLLDDVSLEILPLPQLVSPTLVLKNVQFAKDSFQLNLLSQSELEKWVNYLKSWTAGLIEIAGHTDHTGTTTYNQELSQHRAEAVHSFLIEKGVMADILQVKGYGAKAPLNLTMADKENALNRRVELRFLKIPEGIQLPKW